MIVVLGLIALGCGVGAFNDFKNGSSRHAHEEIESSRDQLPLNFWMGVGSKIFSMILALGIAAALIVY